MKMDKHKVLEKMLSKCVRRQHFQKSNFFYKERFALHTLYTNEDDGKNFLNFQKIKNRNNAECSKVVLFDIEFKSKEIKQKINKAFLGGILLSSLTISFIELNLMPSFFGYILSLGGLVFYTCFLSFYNSFILRAVFDYNNKCLLLYPFMLMKVNNCKKQTILFLHEINRIKKTNRYIQIYLKRDKTKSIFHSFPFYFFPFYFPRYNYSQNNTPQKGPDILYSYDFNNLNISAFGPKQKTLSGISGRRENNDTNKWFRIKHNTEFELGIEKNIHIRKSVDGLPLDLMEERKVWALLNGETEN